MSTTSSPPTKATTPPPTILPSPSQSPSSKAAITVSASPPALMTTAAAVSPSSPTSLMSPPSLVPATTPSGITTSTSTTLNVPHKNPTKPSRQAATNSTDKASSAGSPGLTLGSNSLSGLPSGLTPAALSLSPSGVTRLGSKSPSSIPSSPTSIHSSSSAIFERDIEPLGVPSLSVPLQTAAIASGSSQHGRTATTATSTANAHRIPRSKTTEAIEMTVPSVLDSAVSALTIAEETGTNITVLSPVPTQGAHPLVQHSTSNLQSPLSAHSQSSPIASTFTQPNLAAPGGVGSIGSTSGTSGGSPSPPTMSLLLQGMGMSGLMSASASVSGAASASGFASGFASPLSSSRAPSPARSVSPPVHNNISEITPSITSGSPRSATKEAPNVGSSPLKRPSLPPPGLGSNQNMPSPNMRASNRLSFISYTDLLTSAPIASQPLSAVLSPGQNEPPTHLVVVDADNAPSVVGSGTNASSSHLPLGIGSLNVSNPSDKVDVDSLGTVGLSSAGEWGREGMGGGLEERLERLWAAEKEINERGRVMKPNGSASRSASIGVSIDTSQPAPSTTTTT